MNNSAGLAAALSDETGTGSAVFSNTPSLTTPDIGAATGTSVVLTGDATVRHLVGVAGTPSVAWGSGAGTSPTGTSISVKDIGGTISFTTGNFGVTGNAMIARITSI